MPRPFAHCTPPKAGSKALFLLLTHTVGKLRADDSGEILIVDDVTRLGAGGLFHEADGGIVDLHIDAARRLGMVGGKHRALGIVEIGQLRAAGEQDGVRAGKALDVEPDIGFIRAEGERVILQIVFPHPDGAARW